MRRKMISFYAVVGLFYFSMLFLVPIRVMAGGDGAWTTTASPGYIILTQEDMFVDEQFMAMTILAPSFLGGITCWGRASASEPHTYLLRSLIDEVSDMQVTWKFNSPTQATVTVNSCTANCLWGTGQVVTLDLFFGDKGMTTVPKTGQTESYQEYDDGYYQKGVSSPGVRFEDNGDGTVTDHLTGLIWLKDANCFGKKTWYEALTICHGLQSGECGLTDNSFKGLWRLPNRYELESLLDMSQHSPSLSSGHPFTSVQSFYWLSTSYSLNTDLAWIVFLANGSVSWDSKTYSYYVWPVRGGQ